jgi:DNA-binding NtrC family response regulator
MLADEIRNDPEFTNCDLSMAESFAKVKTLWENKFTNNPPDVVILDHFLSGSYDGIYVARWMLNKAPSLRIIVNTAYPFMETDDGVAYEGYIKLKKEGYHVDFLHKDSKSKTEGIPVWHEVLRPALIRAIDAIKIANGEMSGSFRNLCSRLCAKSKPFIECLKSIERVMPTDINVLLLGKNGTGKGKVAHEIHKGSKRKNGPFIAVNCAATPEGLIEAEFFGYKKGAFAGAVRDHRGFFLQASGGTLFLDEVTEIPIHLQSKLLRAIQEKEIQRLGDDKKHKIDIRILSATNIDMGAALLRRP